MFSSLCIIYLLLSSLSYIKIYILKERRSLFKDKAFRFFLTNSQCSKLFIFNELCLNVLSISELQNKLNVNKQKLKILIKNLEQDIEEVNKKIAISSLFNDKNRSILSRELTSEELVSLRNSLEEKYISTSAQYKGLLFILEKRSFNITQLSKYLSFSKSYTYKILDKIIFFLSTIDNKLYFSKLNETFIILTGDEIVIRLLHLHLISIKKTNEEILGLSDMFIQDT